jgi:hypothetical protein
MGAQGIGPAPAVTLKAIGHGRELTINALGRPALLVFVARESSDQARPIIDAIREHYPTVEQLIIANVADLRTIPRLIRKVAEQLMKSSYKDAVERLEEWKTPEEYVLILPDWDGEALQPLGIEDVRKTVAFAALTADGNVASVYQGDDPVPHLLAMLEKAGATPPQA